MRFFNANDSEKTQIQENTSENPVASTDDLAQEFLKELGGGRSGFEPTVVDNPEQLEQRHAARNWKSTRNPARAAILALLIPGGGNFYLGSVAVGTVLFVMSAMSLGFGLFYSAQGLPRPLVLLAGLGVSAFFWWVGVVWSTTGAHYRQISTHVPYRSNIAMFFSSPIPAIGHYVQRKLLRGHLTALALFLLLVGGTALAIWFTRVSSFSAAEVKEVQEVFSIAAGIAAVGLIGVLFGTLVAILGSFCEIQKTWRGNAKLVTEKKFVLLGSAVLAAGLFYCVVGQPGSYARLQLDKLDGHLKSRPEHVLTDRLRLDRALRMWGNFSDEMHDRLDLIK